MTDHRAQAEAWAAEARQTGGTQGITYAITALVHALLTDYPPPPPTPAAGARWGWPPDATDPDDNLEEHL